MFWTFEAIVLAALVCFMVGWLVGSLLSSSSSSFSSKLFQNNFEKIVNNIWANLLRKMEFSDSDERSVISGSDDSTWYFRYADDDWPQVSSVTPQSGYDADSSMSFDDSSAESVSSRHSVRSHSSCSSQNSQVFTIDASNADGFLDSDMESDGEEEEAFETGTHHGRKGGKQLSKSVADILSQKCCGHRMCLHHISIAEVEKAISNWQSLRPTQKHAHMLTIIRSDRTTEKGRFKDVSIPHISTKVCKKAVCAIYGMSM